MILKRSLMKLAISFLFITTYSANVASNEFPSFEGLVVPAIGIDNLPYKNSDLQIAPSLIVMGRLGDLFIEGNRAGYLVNRSALGALSVMGQVRTHQYIPQESTFGTRDKSMELGLQLAKPLAYGWTGQVTAFTDVSDTHQGSELELSVYRRDYFGENFRLLTMFAAQQQDQKLTSFYADAMNYKADADLNLEFELLGVYEFNQDWSAVVVYRHYFHGDGIAQSPITDKDETIKLALGIGYRF